MCVIDLMELQWSVRANLYVYVRQHHLPHHEGGVCVSAHTCGTWGSQPPCITQPIYKHTGTPPHLMWDEFEGHPMRKDYTEPFDYEWEPTPHHEVKEKYQKGKGIV